MHCYEIHTKLVCPKVFRTHMNLKPMSIPHEHKLIFKLGIKHYPKTIPTTQTHWRKKGYCGYKN